MKNALRTIFAIMMLGIYAVVMSVIILFDWFTDPRPYPMGRRNRL